MTRDEIRGLIGGYATGSLSPAERKALFDAALDDQELFDELAGEQALKELLDEPGVKARLMTALAPRQKPSPLHAPGWHLHRAWVWAAAGAFATAVIVGIVLLEKPGERQIAQVIAPPPVPEQLVPAPAAATAAAPNVAKAVIPTPAASKLEVSSAVVAGEAKPVAPAPATQPAPPPPAPRPAPAPPPPAASANGPAAAAAGATANEAFAISGTVAGGLQGAQGARGGGGGG